MADGDDGLFEQDDLTRADDFGGEEAASLFVADVANLDGADVVVNRHVNVLAGKFNKVLE